MDPETIGGWRWLGTRATGIDMSTLPPVNPPFVEVGSVLTPENDQTLSKLVTPLQTWTLKEILSEKHDETEFQGSPLPLTDSPWTEFSNNVSTPVWEEEELPAGVNGMLVLAGVALSLLALGTAMGNALVLHAIRTQRRLQTVSNLFIMSLAVADLTVGLIVMPIGAAYFVAGEWRWGVVVCQIWLSVDYTASTASIFNLFILSLDRYWSVSNPLRYLSKRTRKRALILIGGSWAAASLWLVPLLAWHHIFYGGRRQHPSHVCETEFSDSITFKVVTSVLNFYGPSALMVFLYCRIFRTIKQRSLDLLGRVTPASNHNTTTTANLRKTFRNLTLVALPDHGKDISTSFYKGILVQVEYTTDTYSSSSHSTNLNPLNLNGPKVRDEDGYSRGSKNSKLSNHSSLSPTKRGDKNHQHHLACYPVGVSGLTKVEDGLPSTSNSRLPSFRLDEQRVGLTTLRGLLPERQRPSTVTLSDPIGGHERRNGVPINLLKEKKAARQLGVIMGAFFACWIPYFTLFPIIAFCDRGCIPDRMHMAATWLGYLNSALNPVIYPLCNHHFRRAFSTMLHCKPR